MLSIYGAIICIAITYLGGVWGDSTTWPDMLAFAMGKGKLAGRVWPLVINQNSLKDNFE